MTQLYILQFNLSTQNYILAQDLEQLSRILNLKPERRQDIAIFRFFSKKKSNFFSVFVINYLIITIMLFFIHFHL